MPCKLRLNNPDERGGTYRGEGIAKLISDIRHQLEDNYYTGPRRNDDDITFGYEPHVFFNYSEDGRRRIANGEGTKIAAMFEDDASFDAIRCVGFGEDEAGGPKNSCEDCPYLQKPNLGSE